MARVKIRTHPIDVFYLTGEDAREARDATQGGVAGNAPCFTTSSFGGDGFAWDTAEGFEADYRMTFPNGGLGPVEVVAVPPDTARLRSLELEKVWEAASVAAKQQAFKWAITDVGGWKNVNDADEYRRAFTNHRPGGPVAKTFVVLFKPGSADVRESYVLEDWHLDVVPPGSHFDKMTGHG